MMSLIKHLLKTVEPYILYLKLGYWPPTSSQISKPKTFLDLALETMESITFTDGLYVYSNELSSVRVPVYANTAREQVALTTTLANALEFDLPISKSALEGVIKSIYLRDFFLDFEGNYDDTLGLSVELLEASKRLIRLYIEKEESIETDTNTFRNRIVLAPITKVIANHYKTIEQYASNRTGHQNGNAG